MNKQVIKEAEELIESHSKIANKTGWPEIDLKYSIRHAIKTQERVISELEESVKENFPIDATYDLVWERIDHNEEILKYLKQVKQEIEEL